MKNILRINLVDGLAMDNNNIISTNVNNITPKSTITYDEYSFSSYYKFWDILNFTIQTIGTVANITMLALLVKDKEKKTSYTVYIGAIMVNDIIQLILSFLKNTLYYLFDYDLYTVNIFACNFMYYLELSVWMLHGWLLLLLTTERLINAYFPRMPKLFDRRSTGIIAASLIICATLFINIHYVLHLDTEMYPDPSDGSVRCFNPDVFYEDEYTQYYYYLYVQFIH